MIDDDDDDIDDVPEDRQLTTQQEAFVLHYTSTDGAIGNAAEAARRAGYSEKSARELGRQLLDKPHVARAVDKANRQTISGKLATKAVGLLEKVMDDEAVPIKVRVEAAKTILDRAGIVAPTTAERIARTRDPEKMLRDMTIEELEAIVRDGQKALMQGKTAGGSH